MYFECNKDREVEGSSWKPKTSKDHVYASELVDGLIVKVSISAAHLVPHSGVISKFPSGPQ